MSLFRGPRVAPRMRISSFALVLAAALSTVACGPRNSDKLDDNELATADGGAGANDSVGVDDTRCTARATQDEVKRQLFARASEIRGANADNYARIAGFALLQVDGAAPLAATSSSAQAECRGRATLRLPAGLRVAGGRTTLGGDISYSVAAGAGAPVTLGQSDSIAIPLATLTQNRAPAPRPAPVPVPTQSDPLAPAPQPAPTPQPAPQPAPPPETSIGARPSFDCRRARTSGERAVCASPALAALDRGMAAQYNSAVANSGPDQRRLLARTRGRFLTYRDRCNNDSCIANTYRGRMREIDDIAAGRWRGER